MRLGTSKSFFIQILFFLEHKHQDCKLSSFGHVCSLWTDFANGGMCWHFAVVFFFEVVVCSFFCWDVFFSRSKNNEWFLERAASDLLFWSLFLWTISVFETIFGCVVFCFFTSQDVKMNIRSLTNPSSLPRFLSPRLVVLVQISLHFFKNTRKIAEEKRELKKVGMHYHYQKY